MPPHLIHKSKIVLSKNENLQRIHHENNLLIDKMTEIGKRNNKHITERRICLESPSAFSLHQSVLMKNSDKIIVQNGVSNNIESSTKAQKSKAHP